MNGRIYVTKKDAYQVEATSLLAQLRTDLGMAQLKNVILYNVYDVFHADEHDMELLKSKVLSEAVTDQVFDELSLAGKTYVAYECLPGQYDQRADSAQQCLMLLNNKQDVVIKSGKIVVLEGEVGDAQLAAVKHYLINPVEMREKDLSVLAFEEDVEIEPVETVTDFIHMCDEAIEAYRNAQGLAMTTQDLCYIRDYFANEEHRDPTITEIKVLDTYWSDHCRHTTFETVLQNVKIEKGTMQKSIQKAYELYLHLREAVHENRKPQTLMDMATVAGKYLRKQGKLDDLEISDEINACSVEIDVDVDGKTEKWLLMFKNETHNHPTEIEPFGGAATCIGGAIRDPLSGRSYVYQAMRITGAGDITADLADTLPNKLPQSRISKSAAHGYSSYGNQIGLATTYVKEIYHEGYVAKRMEVGAVVGAAPKANVKRLKPQPGDIVVLIGGATGRDGIGGATGSSKEHNETSLSKCSSEVQKGNAPTERKLQRLFRDPQATKLIKKANDFGAGGVSVAIGELAEGIAIDLDRVPVKYAGLNGTELAISESQERMACVIAKADYEKFKELAYRENLEATIVAEVSETPRLVMKWRGQVIVDIARSFLDTNGVRQYQDVVMKDTTDLQADPFASKTTHKDVKQAVLDNLAQPNTASQKGLVEMFDATIGKSTVLMPYGGAYQLSESEGSVQKLPVFGYTDTASVMTYGYNPEIAVYSPYLAGSYSVVEALARMVALGCDYRHARLSNQEYFERLNDDSGKWGKPMQALLGVIEAQIAFETPAIGGKDSMSGTFKDLHVPPTIITFAVATQSAAKIVSSEFKQAGNYLYFVKHTPKEDHAPDFEQLKHHFDTVLKHMEKGTIVSASTVKYGGIAEAVCKMGFGNKIGAHIESSEPLFDLNVGGIVVEATCELQDACFTPIGKTSEGGFVFNGTPVGMEEAIHAWMHLYEGIYPSKTDVSKEVITTPVYEAKQKKKASRTYDKPKVIIPVFPGTNCEYDTKQAFERAGAEAEIYVFNNLSVESIQRSLKELSEKIAAAQILMIPGGFSSGDEPDGSGKFIANVLRNEQVNNAIQTLLSNDGLILGICNGFQALIKSGLLPYGDIEGLNETSPTLFRNNINRHVSKIGTTKVTSNMSPWLAGFTPGELHKIAFSHGEGKFVVRDDVAKELFENGQVATQYTDLDGQTTMNGEYNINGSSFAIEGITSKDGRIFGKMGHSERYEENLFKNIYGNKMQDIFKNGVDYFKK
ncbi:phosphoribosylformylglycinamidine synthase [Massilicoli timonensis]|uniref:Phosphoribosylformylglycinamidine synthase n=1 Tax=Massilicoli timonensis TaxID=2015901 RepID=A0ABT1SKE6_9FIRM|nr:phosphoribosylformylglycinamidine synthase [Massilicoli timonensis]MCQ5121696.1 phosphoribosylformylglycinamidine synthase [Massilicoli timonensis]